MGNQVNKTFANCCTQDFCRNKKEVNFPNDNIELESVTPRVRNNKDPNPKQSLPSESYNFSMKKKDGFSLESEYKIDYTNAERLKHLEQVVAKAPILVLKVLNSSTLPQGTEIRINAQGVEDSLRDKKDGITYFGSKKKSDAHAEAGGSPEIINDYVIRCRDPDTNDRHRGRHFQIEYSIDSNSYKIRDLGVGFGAFVRLEQPLALKDNNLLSMGTSFLIVNLDDEQNDPFMYTVSKEQENLLNGTQGDEWKSKGGLTDRGKSGRNHEIAIKIFGGPNYGDIFRFDSSIPIIKIGRMPDCEIRVDDNLLSKYQGSIKYVPHLGWTLYDGSNGKASTNGNWLYLNDDFEMFNGMIFKANHTLFEVFIEGGNKK